jgi:NADPH2:quinone reductase
VVDAVGEGVTAFEPGDRVCVVGMGGGYAERAIAPVVKVVKLPPWMDFTQGAVFRSAYTTAYHALVQAGRLAAGQTVLVLGAGGAVGMASVQLSKALGGFTIASASSEPKRILARTANADYVLDSSAPDWRERVREITGGRGVDIVLDPVNGPGMERAFRSLAWGGRHVVIGFAYGEIHALPTNLPLLKGASLVGLDIRQFAEREPDRYVDNLRRIFELFEKRRLICQIAQRYPLSEFAAAMEAVSRGALAGRAVLDVG